jgi:antitoxin YefM
MVRRTVKIEEARTGLDRLIDETTESHEPVGIAGARGNAVILSEADWRSIEETLHLLAVPGMRESIREGMDTPLEECGEDPSW